MSDPARMTKIPAFVKNRTRSAIYEVLAAYAAAGLGHAAALASLEAAYAAKGSGTAGQIRAVAERGGGEDLGGALLAVFSVLEPEEAALLRGIPRGADMERAQGLHAAAVLLSRAAAAAAGAA